MKTKLFILLPFLCFICGSVYAQCTADAGEDRIICPEDEGNAVTIGGNPTASGGTAPYTYRWYSKLTIDGKHYPASSGLDDTTLSNPSIKWVMGTYYLEVTDANQHTCYDSVGIGISYFVIDLEVKSATINFGDSIRLRTSVSGGWQPYTYSWSPGNSLEDSTKVNTWAKPTKYTNYKLTITDSAGCVADDYYKVKVKNSGVSDHVDESFIRLYPNPNKGAMTIAIPNEFVNSAYTLTNLTGMVMKQGSITSTSQQLDWQSIQRGMYMLTIANGSVQHVMRVVVE